MGKTPKAKLSSSVVVVPSTLTRLKDAYMTTTCTRLKIMDAYLLYVFLTGFIQLVYCYLVGTFPFNSFLAGFVSCVASFVFGVCLRLHSNPENARVFDGTTREGAFGEFIIANMMLHLAVMNFIDSEDTVTTWNLKKMVFQESSTNLQGNLENEWVIMGYYVAVLTVLIIYVGGISLWAYLQVKDFDLDELLYSYFISNYCKDHPQLPTPSQIARFSLDGSIDVNSIPSEANIYRSNSPVHQSNQDQSRVARA